MFFFFFVFARFYLLDCDLYDEDQEEGVKSEHIEYLDGEADDEQ